ncbi:MAG: hypothetical protein INR69_22935, partial [Mucilaginibacter polytrichastri]|nr:hypothetical protein [Mucilaginibacter polytrichastri]
PIGDTLFELEKIPLHHVKVDVAEMPDDLMPSWLGFLVDNNLKRSDWPFVKWWIEKLIVPKIQEDIEINEAFKGVRGTITSGTATAAGASIDGVRKTIRMGNTAGKTKLITMGAAPVDPVDFVNYIEDFVAQIPELYRNLLDGLNMSKTLRDRFKTGMRTKYNVNYAQIGELLTVIDTDIKVNGSIAQAGSEMIWTTIKGNTARPVKFGENQGKFDIQLFERQVKLLSDWYVGYGFWYMPWVFHNDRDLI